MLKPTKSTDLNLAIPRVAATILKIMSKQRTLSYVNLFDKLCKKLGEDVRYVFLPALWFLYLMGVIKYYPKTDCFVLITNYETK